MFMACRIWLKAKDSPVCVAILCSLKHMPQAHAARKPKHMPPTKGWWWFANELKKRCLYFQETDNSVPGALQGTEKSSIEQPFMIERIHHYIVRSKLPWRERQIVLNCPRGGPRFLEVWYFRWSSHWYQKNHGCFNLPVKKVGFW